MGWDKDKKQKWGLRGIRAVAGRGQAQGALVKKVGNVRRSFAVVDVGFGAGPHRHPDASAARLEPGRSLRSRLISSVDPGGPCADAH
jgi:hypothetical protein